MVGRFSLYVVLAVAVVAEGVNDVPEQKIPFLVAAAAGEFPYHVSLRKDRFSTCSGAIIGARHIVTSAICVHGSNIDDFFVVTGSILGNVGGRYHLPKKIVINPEFTTKNRGANDIAIVSLVSGIQYDADRNMVSLPSHGTPGGVLANLTGWAAFAKSSEIESLKKLSMKTISTEGCQPNVTGVVDGGHICAAAETGLDTCMFDYGAPLVSDGVLVGVLSYGNPCGERWPGVFTSVYHHIKWIRKVLAEE